MRRRVQEVAPEPPAKLRAFDARDWLPMVDLSEYDPEMYRNRGPGGPYGPPSVSLEDWARQQTRNLWSRARLAWHQEHGWPGGLTAVDLLRQERAARPGRPDPMNDQALPQEASTSATDSG